MNCYVDRDVTSLPLQEREEQLAFRRRRVVLYANLVLLKLDADVQRLAAAAEQCRTMYEQRVAEGADPRSDRTGGLARGAQVAEAAIELIRQARADVRPAARKRLLRQVERDTALFPEPGPAGRLWQWLRMAVRNSRWLRKPRRLDPSWQRRRAELADVELHHSPAQRAADIGVVEALLHGQVVGRAAYQSCSECRRGLLCKVSAYSDGAGFGTLLVDACVTHGGRPADGYTWYTTPQDETARGFWRAMSRRHRTPFTPPFGRIRCPHMD